MRLLKVFLVLEMVVVWVFSVDHLGFVLGTLLAIIVVAFTAHAANAPVKY